MKTEQETAVIFSVNQNIADIAAVCEFFDLLAKWDLQEKGLTSKYKLGPLKETPQEESHD